MGQFHCADVGTQPEVAIAVFAESIDAVIEKSLPLSIGLEFRLAFAGVREEFCVERVVPMYESFYRGLLG